MGSHPGPVRVLLRKQEPRVTREVDSGPGLLLSQEHQESDGRRPAVGEAVRIAACSATAAPSATGSDDGRNGGEEADGF